MPATASPTSILFSAQNVHQAFKLALSLTLFYWWGLWTNQPFFDYGALAILLCSLSTQGATIEKGIARVVGTTFGVLVGFVILACFNHDRWATMIAFSCYLAFVAYFMQGSRNDYAWFVAAFVPLIVWADNFPNFYNAFQFGSYRWLETTSGIVLYTIVDLVLWPRQAGDQLNRQGQSLWGGVQQLLACYRNMLGPQDETADPAPIFASVAGDRAGAFASLQHALLDTPGIKRQRKVWNNWQSSTEALIESLTLWHPTITDVRHLDLDVLLPRLDPALQTLESRLARIGDLWPQQFSDGSTCTQNLPPDSELLQTLDLDVDHSTLDMLPPLQRAALACLVDQLKTIDHASNEVLRCGRVLADLDTHQATETSSPHLHVVRPEPWVEQRFVHSLFPVVTFVSAFLFWVYWNPPTGASIPMFAGILGLSTLRSPMDPRIVVAAFPLAIFLTVAPVSWLVLPHLDNGFELLVFIFAYSFLFAWLGAFNPLLRLAPILLFIMVSGISNAQTFSFNGFVDGALMIVMGGAFVAVAYTFFSTMRPEVALRRWHNRFFVGCERFTREVNRQQITNKGKTQASRQRALQSMVLPSPAKIGATQKQLSYKSFPDNLREDLHHLQNGIQSIADRLQSLEIVVNRSTSGLQDHCQRLAPFGQEPLKTLQDVFQSWSAPEADPDITRHLHSLKHASADLRSALNEVAAKPRQEQLSDSQMYDLYVVVGSIRGLIDSMINTQYAMQDIDWQQLAMPRF